MDDGGVVLWRTSVEVIALPIRGESCLGPLDIAPVYSILLIPPVVLNVTLRNA